MKIEYSQWLCFACNRRYRDSGRISEVTPDPTPEDYRKDPTLECTLCGEKVYYLSREIIITEPDVRFYGLGGYRNWSRYNVSVDGKKFPHQLEYTQDAPKTFEECKTQGFNVQSEEDAFYNFIGWDQTIHWQGGDDLIPDEVFEAFKIAFKRPNVRRAILRYRLVETTSDDPRAVGPSYPWYHTDFKIEYY